jgi:hypothetical protein
MLGIPRPRDENKVNLYRIRQHVDQCGIGRKRLGHFQGVGVQTARSQRLAALFVSPEERQWRPPTRTITPFSQPMWLLNNKHWTVDSIARKNCVHLECKSKSSSKSRVSRVALTSCVDQCSRRKYRLLAFPSADSV